MAPSGVNGDVAPRSTRKPTFLPVLFHSTVVPALTQKSELLLAPGIPGVDEAPLPVRFMSTLHGVDVEPQVLATLHICAGFASAHVYERAF